MATQAWPWHPQAWPWQPLLVALMLVTVVALEFGCRPSSSSSRAPGSRDPEVERMQRREMFNYAMRSIFNYEQYDSSEVLQQAVGRLDQWVKEQEPLPGWRLDPMVATLPKPLSDLPGMMKLDQLDFPDSDRFAFLEAVWLRDVSSWARGDAVDELDQARQLFDWTVRNVQLGWGPGAEGSAAAGRFLQKPWETLLFGRGTATDRAWLFVLLARQQRIDAAVLGLTDPEDRAGERARPWVVAVLSQGQLYLFDPTLGLPIPAPDGVKRDRAGQLDIQPATLAQVAADDALLRQLDVLDVEPPYRYPVEASQAENVVALVEASPVYLSQRMALVESQLAGDEQLVLTTDPSAQAQRFKACPHVVDVRLWAMPYQTLVQELQLEPARKQWQRLQLVPFMAAGQVPTLWRGRQYHLKGVFTGDESAATYYQMARVPERFLNSEGIDPGIKLALVRAKMDASYWLGLLAEQQGNHQAAVDWLAVRTLKASPDGPWTWGAKYNLGRVYEAEGETVKAVEMYQSDAGPSGRPNPARHGNLLRARWLQPPQAPESTEGPPAETTEGTQGESLNSVLPASDEDIDSPP